MIKNNNKALNPSESVKAHKNSIKCTSRQLKSVDSL